jgi:hypothetical protein
MQSIRSNGRATGRRVTSIVVLALALGAGVAPSIAQAGELSYASGVLTYTGGNEENSVTIDHPGINSDTPASPSNLPVMGKLLIRENAFGEDVTIGPSADPHCDLDAFYGVQCDVPTRFVANLGGNDDSTLIGTDDVPVAVEIHADGGPGADFLDGGAGRNVVNGGAGNDELNGHGGGDVLSGDDGDDQLAGGEGNDELNGGLGADGLTGGAGNDVVRGGDGDDELDYFPAYELDGADTYEGGAGYDIFGYFGRTVSIRVNLDGLANDGQSGENDNVGLDIEEVDGGDVADVLVGSAGPEGLAGRGGNDQISGRGGGDILYGDSGNDGIDGGDGNDTLDGGCHDDTIIGGPGVDALNSDGTCADPSQRGVNDVLHARDGVKDSLVLCTMSGPAGDTAVVDAVDPALPVGNPGACRTIDASATPGGGESTPGGGSTTPVGGSTTSGGGSTTPGTTTPGGMTLEGTVRARLGSTLRLLTGTSKAGQAVRQSVHLKAKPPKLTLGSLVATSASRLTAAATSRRRGRTVSLGRATLTVEPGTPQTLSIKLSKKGKSALRRLKKASIKVRFTVRDPITKKVSHRSTKAFRVSIKR